ncbi:hypothetical protein [Mammaliicoccus phage vB_MscM-PMS3]|nr:hypothetical protein [Mammaliicoccus phage vB_MscM-PMS3]
MNGIENNERLRFLANYLRDDIKYASLIRNSDYSNARAISETTQENILYITGEDFQGHWLLRELKVNGIRQAYSKYRTHKQLIETFILAENIIGDGYNE